MNDTDWKLVFDNESGALCRVVCYDDVDFCYIITPVAGASGRWNDMKYDGVKASQITEATDKDLSAMFRDHLKETQE